MKERRKFAKCLTWLFSTALLFGTVFNPVSAKADGITLIPDTVHSYTPTQIVNGDFEQYPTQAFVWNGQTFYRNQLPYVSGASGKPQGGAVVQPIPNGVGEGWNTTEVQVSQYGMPYDYCKIVNVSSTVFDTYSINATYNDALYQATKNSRAVNGKNYTMIEMNYYSPAVFWQDLYTQGGDVIIWTLEHSTRATSGSTPEIIHAEIGAPLYSGGQMLPATGLGANKTTNIEATSKAVYRYNGVTNGSKNAGYGRTDDLKYLYLVPSSDCASWRKVTGIYMVPTNQNVTRFSFISDSPLDANGNLLDSLTFSTLIGNLHGIVHSDGGDVSVEVYGYWGETNASKKLVCKIGEQTVVFDMTEIVNGSNKNFTFTIPASTLGDAKQVEIYHEDYEQAKRVVKIEHQHHLVYEESGNTLKVYCDEEQDKQYCDHSGIENAITLILVADNELFSPSSTTYNGVRLEGADEFTEFTGIGVSANETVYTKIGSDHTETPVVSLPISEAGKYRASLTIAGHTFTKVFRFDEELDEPEVTTTTITIPNPAEGTEYAILDDGGNRVTEWKDTPDSEGKISFTGLDPNTEYTIIAVDKETLVEAWSEGVEPDEEECTFTEVWTAIDPLAPEDGIDPASPYAPKVLPYDISVVILDANEDYKYALLAEDKETVKASFRAASEGKVLFTDLTPNTKYVLVAKTDDNDTSAYYELRTLPLLEEPVVTPGATSMTVTNASSANYYAIFDESGDLVAGWTNRPDSHGKVKFGALKQATSYEIVAVTATDYELIAEGGEALFGKSVDVKTGLDISAPSAEEGNELRIVATDDGCRIWYANPDFEYAVIDGSGQQVKEYKKPDAEGFLEITGLSPDTEYFLTAKCGDVTSSGTKSFKTLSEGDSLYGKIDYTVRADVLLYAYDEGGAQTDEIYLNMTTEKLVSAFSYNGYSINGGKTWKEGKIKDKEFEKLFNSGFSLVLTDKYDKKTKKPTEEAVFYYFDKVEKRPSTKPFKVNYSLYSDKYGVTNGQWTLTFNRQVADMTRYEIGEATSDGKKIGKNGYGLWPDKDGVWVPSSGADGKTKSITYYYRTIASEVCGASKVKKIKVSTAVKAPKLKVNYKTETVVLPAGYNCYFGASMPHPLRDQITYENGEKVFDEYDIAAHDKLSDYEGKGILKTTAKVTLNLSGYITESRNSIFVWTCAKETKPASAKQEIKLAARAKVSSQTLKVTKGKISALPKGYEVKAESSDKWSTSLPKVTGSVELEVRVKATASGGKETNDTKATSASGTLSITWGVIDQEKGTEGVVSAKIIP